MGRHGRYRRGHHFYGRGFRGCRGSERCSTQHPCLHGRCSRRGRPERRHSSDRGDRLGACRSARPEHCRAARRRIQRLEWSAWPERQRSRDWRYSGRRNWCARPERREPLHRERGAWFGRSPWPEHRYATWSRSQRFSGYSRTERGQSGSCGHVDRCCRRSRPERRAVVEPDSHDRLRGSARAKRGDGCSLQRRSRPSRCARTVLVNASDRRERRRPCGYARSERGDPR